MNKAFRWGMVVVAVIAVTVALWPGGVVQAGLAAADVQSPYGQMGPGSMHDKAGGGVYTDTLPYGPHSGVMGGMGMMGMMGSGMMGQGYGMGSIVSPSLYGIEPLSLDEAEGAVEDYLAGLDSEDLVVGEIMIFDNHAYVQVIEESTGVGAMELLVDPVLLAVLPEPGPNMMWNSRYGHMAGFGMMGSGMMSLMQGFNNMPQQGGMMGNVPQATAEMSVSAEEAIETAQRYLDRYLPGAEADEEADAFYGYYTIHILRDGETVGMLSVNGYSRQVFLHTWHGDLVEMSESHG